MTISLSQTAETFSKFGKSFQEKLVKIILFDRVFANQMEEVLDNKYLELKYLQVFTQLVFDYKQNYGTHPTLSIMASVVRTEMEDYSDVIQRQVREYLVRIKTAEGADEEEGYVKEKSLEFCKKQKLKEAILESVDLLQKSSYDDIAKVINDAMLLGSSNDFGHEYIEDFEERYTIQSRNPITTGWGEIDEIVRGGLGKRELGVVIAATGSGKSMAMVHLGSRALVLGKTVVHYTLELADTTVAQRYDSCITQVPLGKLFNYKDEVKEKIINVEGKLIVKEYPTKSASVKTLESHLEKLRQKGVEPDMIIVDYADLLRPAANGFKSQELRHSLEGIYESLRALAQKYDCPVWTCSQTNRSGINADVITMESISEAFNKCFVADFICSIARTKEDKMDNSGRMFVAKNRNGIDGVVFPMEIDLSKVHMHVLPPDDGYQLRQVIVTTKKEQEEKLRNKYKEFASKRQTNKNMKNSDKSNTSEKPYVGDMTKNEFRQGLRDLKNKIDQEKTGEN
jgi:replicative DNA helicase